MSFATANGAAVQTMRLAMPARGVWTADLETDAVTPPALGTAAVIEVGTFRLQGTVTRPGADENGAVSFAVAGGAAKLAAELAPKSFGPTTVEVVLRELLAAAGEKRGLGIVEAILKTPLPRWGRQRQTGKAALSALADQIGATWRVLDDGGIWLGTDAGDEPAFDYDLVEERPKDDVLIFAAETLELRPGHTFRGGPVATVEYRVTGSRMEVSATRLQKAKDRKIDAKIEKAQAATKLHPPRFARVVSQNEDGTLELALEVPPGKPAEVAPVSRVPIWHGIRGVTEMRVSPRTRVALFHDGGDITRPFAALFDKGGRLLSWKVDVDLVELGGTVPTALEPPIASWADRVDSAIASLAAAVVATGAAIPAGMPFTPPPTTPPGPLTDAASEVLFTR